MQLKNPITNKQTFIEYSLYQSKKGHYFIGQTPTLVGSNSHAATTLVNPSDSYVGIYLNAITVTNISEENISAEINIFH